MYVFLTDAEYRMVCRVSDAERKPPAALAHDWIVTAAHRKCLRLMFPRAGGEGMLGSEVDPAAEQGGTPA